jgi:uncharacterized membrane protein
LARIHCGGNLIRDNDLFSLLALGQERKIEQDPAFAFRVIVDIAEKALSPAINDPFTAVTCLDHLGAGLSLYAEQHRKAEHFTFIHDKANCLRLVVDALTFAELLDAAFNMIRRAGRENADVAIERVDLEVAHPMHAERVRVWRGARSIDRSGFETAS